MIYLIQETGLFRSRVKIGYTERIKDRMSELKRYSPSGIKLLLVLPGDKTDEYILHQICAPYRLHGEWFRFGFRLRLFVWVTRLKLVDYKPPTHPTVKIRTIQLDKGVKKNE